LCSPSFYPLPDLAEAPKILFYLNSFNVCSNIASSSTASPAFFFFFFFFLTVFFDFLDMLL
jgi:hypothetical protein